MKRVNDYSCTLLKLERLKQKKGQKEVCYGICVPSYLSKIERNQVTPDPVILKQLFQRLGIGFYCDDDFISTNQTLIDQYFEQLTYGLERKAYIELKPSANELTYSPLAIDWLIIQAYEDLENDKDINENLKLLAECKEHMQDRQLAYYDLLFPMENGKLENTIKLYTEAFHILNNSFSLLSLMSAYWLNGQYDKVHEYADKCIQVALEEGNTLNLAFCYRTIGDVYACLNVENLMMPFYNRAIHLLQNTNWSNKLDMIFYNIGATLVSTKQYDTAMEYLNRVTWDDSFLLYQKKALILIRTGKQEEAAEFISQMKGWIEKEEAEGNEVAVEKLMLQETLYECEANFLDNPQYITLMETLMERLENDRHKGFLIFYKDNLSQAYCRQRKYKKALELNNRIS